MDNDFGYDLSGLTPYDELLEKTKKRNRAAEDRRALINRCAIDKKDLWRRQNKLKGWDEERSLTTPKRKYRKNLTPEQKREESRARQKAYRLRKKLEKSAVKDMEREDQAPFLLQKGVTNVDLEENGLTVVKRSRPNGLRR